MKDYIDGFVFPISEEHLNTYKEVAHRVAEIWKEHGATAYFEFIGDDLFLEGTQSFTTLLKAKKEEVIIFGWVVFPSKEIRDLANQKVPLDDRMEKLTAPLTQYNRQIFDASRMAYGGFKSLF
ncbi:MAG: RNA signal recognition particle [Alteromonas sp.]|nr:RNA signal recognition particle [Alteromonas sp.]MAY21944.1 RNA signal recognition particle [Flavobacteriaceae bacterium]|tara:strand:+ start:12605 stop:12973 length:369 start_codon:yes stop_codon:yes gene_type:complete